jgi:hypothetical protein
MEEPHPVVGDIGRIIYETPPPSLVDQLDRTFDLRGGRPEPEIVPAEIVRARKCCRRDSIQRDRPEDVIGVRDGLDAGKWPPSYDSSAVYELGIGNMELVGEEATGRQTRYGDAGAIQVTVDL